MHTSLFKPVKLGRSEVPNRIFMAPLTRCRADVGHIPNALMAEYYAQRAGAGLIIAEATMVSEGNSAFNSEPGIYSEAQVVGWKKVTDAVHQKGGRIALQLWHGGRACHPNMNNGRECVGPSAIAIDSEVHTPQGKVPYAVPRALLDSEIPDIVADFKIAAENAKRAGFDGVEVHGANGYLLDAFLRESSNKRTGQYGGTLENRAKLLLQVTTAVIQVWGADAVGVRISPLNSFNSMLDSDPVAVTKYVATEMQKLGVAYLHIMRSDFFGIQSADVVTPARAFFKGTLVGNMGYSPAEANSAIESGLLDAVAFGHHYVSNPDLSDRIQKGVELVEPDQSTYYSSGAKGYTDYPSA
jgi:N-ethylmaleimide reductase